MSPKWKMPSLWRQESVRPIVVRSLGWVRRCFHSPPPKKAQSTHYHKRKTTNKQLYRTINNNIVKLTANQQKNTRNKPTRAKQNNKQPNNTQPNNNQRNNEHQTNTKPYNTKPHNKGFLWIFLMPEIPGTCVFFTQASMCPEMARPKRSMLDVHDPNVW